VNHIKVFMQNVRECGIVAAVQAVVEWLDASLNPYTQLREAQAWAADYRVVIDELAEENVRLDKCIALYKKAVPVGGVLWAISTVPNDEYPLIPYIKKEQNQ
jgi:hypothetical protein